MTTTRINHTGHNHPNTTAARTACRKALRTAPVEVPTYAAALVGKGKALHLAFLGHDGALIGTRCGAGMGRGVKKNSPYYAAGSVPLADITCRGCSSRFGIAHN